MSLRVPRDGCREKAAGPHPAHTGPLSSAGSLARLPIGDDVLPIQAGPREVVIRKTADDGFSRTPLAGLLAASGVRSLAVCGVMSEMCVSATARTALTLGFRVVIAHDAHATYDIPPAPGLGGLIPAAVVSRVAEWALGDGVEITARAHEVNFTAPTHQESWARSRHDSGVPGIGHLVDRDPGRGARSHGTVR